MRTRRDRAWDWAMGFGARIVFLAATILLGIGLGNVVAPLVWMRMGLAVPPAARAAGGILGAIVVILAWWVALGSLAERRRKGWGR